MDIVEEDTANVLCSVYLDNALGSSWQSPSHVLGTSERLIKIVLFGGDELGALCLRDLAKVERHFFSAGPSFIALPINVVPDVGEALWVRLAEGPRFEPRCPQIRVSAVEAAIEGGVGKRSHTSKSESSLHHL